jgi:hypothetical protein
VGGGDVPLRRALPAALLHSLLRDQAAVLKTERPPRPRRPLPPPLPPGSRTVGQLVAETIRLYGRRFWRALALGLVPGALALGGTFLDRREQFELVAAGGAVLVSLCFVLACTLLVDRPVGRRAFATAWVAAFLIWIPVPFLTILFVLPALAWLALIGMAVPAALIEGVPFRRALGRGLALGRADYVHALGSLAALVIVVFLTQSMLWLLLRQGSDQAARVAVFLANLVVSPLLFLGAALLYYDQAARLEARK